MSYPLENPGVLSVVMERFQKHRLPRIMDIKKMVDDGGQLNQLDINFLSEVFHDTKEYAHFASTNNDYKNLFIKITSLYDDITSKAVNNETKITKISTST